MTQVYLRHIHRVSQNPEADTSGPFEFEGDITSSEDVKKFLRRTLKPMLGRVKSTRPEEGGHTVFWMRAAAQHCTMVLPVGSALHLKHAPPSHNLKN